MLECTKKQRERINTCSLPEGWSVACMAISCYLSYQIAEYYDGYVFFQFLVPVFKLSNNFLEIVRKEAKLTLSSFSMTSFSGMCEMVVRFQDSDIIVK